MAARSTRTQRSSEPTLFNTLPPDPRADIRAQLYAGLDLQTVQDLLERNSAVARAGSAIADRFAGFDVPCDRRLEWPGGNRLLQQRHQIVLNRLSTEELAAHLMHARALERTLGIKPLLAEVLVNRGVETPGAAMQYVHPSLEDALRQLPPFAPLSDAAHALYAAVRAGRKIVVVTDFDADGNCAGALVRRALEIVGGSCELVQPDRMHEGYGLSEKLMPRVLALQPELVVTLDLGTSDRPRFERLRSLGIQTICVDHHKPQAASLSRPDIMANPHLHENLREYHDLCAGGLAWLLSSALFDLHFGAESARAKEHSESLLPFAATAAVADVMRLSGLNRAIVKRGSELMMASQVPAFQALTRSLRNGSVTGEYIGFMVGPMLNACGRINVGTPERPGTFPVSEFLDCREPARAQELSDELMRINRQRQTLERDAVDKVARDALNAQLHEGIPIHCGTVLVLEQVHEGIVGLVAARTTEVMQCPVVVLTRDRDGNFKGSGRSMPGIDLMEILGDLQRQGVVAGGGGHAAAIGVVVEPESLPRFIVAFRRASQERVGALPPRNPSTRTMAQARWMKEYRPDLIMSCDDLCARAAEVDRVAQALEPCGRENPPLTILLPNVRIASCNESDAGHLRITLEDGPNPGCSWLHRERIEALVFARSVASKLLKFLDTSRTLDLVVQPTFDRSRQERGAGSGMSVQVLVAQPSAFAAQNPAHAADTEPRRTKSLRRTDNKSTPLLFDTSAEPEVPQFSSKEEFCRFFGITMVADAAEFRQRQFEFVASQIIRERVASRENLLYRAEVGAGKTFLALLRAAELLSRDPRSKVLYLTTQRDLVEQALQDVKKFLMLEPHEVMEFTGRTKGSTDERQALLRGSARIVVGTPQTFKPFIPPPGADIARSLQAPLASFNLVILDEIHLMLGDGQNEEPSKYAYRAIAGEVVKLQDAGVPIRLWAQSSTPADTAAHRRELTRTLRARYEKLELPARAKRIQTAPVVLDRETHGHLERLRDGYKAIYREMLDALPPWVNDIRLLKEQTPLHDAVIVAKREFLRTCQPEAHKVLPHRAQFLESQGAFSKALGRLSEHYRKTGVQSPRLYATLSRVSELGAALRYFDALRSKGRSAFAREASRKILEALYPAKSPGPAPYSNCYVRLCRRAEMKGVLDWAMTETTANALLNEFRRVYPGEYPGYRWSESAVTPKRRPVAWRTVLSHEDPQPTVDTSGASAKGARKSAPSRLDILDERLFDEFRSSTRCDLKEEALLEILRSIGPDEKVMVMVEQKFEARLLAERLTFEGLQAGWYAGRSVARRLGMRENLQAFRKGDLKVLCSTSSGDTGHDIPQVSRVVRLVPLTSPKRNAQSGGRAGRRAGDEGVYTVMLVADPDPDIDERPMHEIALARLEAMKRV